MTRVHSTGPTRVHGQGRDKSSWHSHRAGRQGVKQRPPSPTAEGPLRRSPPRRRAPRRSPPRRRARRPSPPRPSPLRRRARRRSRTAKPTAAKSTAAKSTAARSTASRASASGTTASRASASPKAPASGSTARSSSRSTTRGTARTAPARTATARTATSRPATARATTSRATTARTTTARRTAAQNGAVSTLPAGVPEGARRTVVLPRSTTTGLEAPRQHQTPAERRVRGKAARAEVPRESHAKWEPSPDRPDPVALLESQGATRVPDLVPVRYGRMMETPFTYYRGAALPMASDLATTPATGMIVQACGDAHLSNFGLFGSPGAPAGLRRQRLRRDAARALGMGREAAGGQPGSGRPGERVQR